NDDFALQFFLVLAVAMAGHALRAAAERCDRALAHFVGRECCNQCETAALLGRAGAWRLGRRGGARKSTAHATAGRTAVIILGFRRNLACSRSAAGLEPCLFLAAKALLCDLIGPALGF